LTVTDNIVNLSVHIHMYFLRNINTSNQSFECSLTLQFQWIEPVSIDCVSKWKPEISFANAINELKIYSSSYYHT
jgi:hypothetical protein